MYFKEHDLKKIILYIFFFVAGFSGVAQNSVLNEGRWYKVSVKEHGVYRLNQDHFRKMGFSPADIDPKNIRIFGYLNGMLPQSNAVQRPDDLVELAIHVKGEEDGSFDGNDFILFYAEGPMTRTFNAGKNVFYLQTNLYTDQNFYFVTVDAGNGKRMTSREPGSGGDLVNSYHDFIFHETNSINILRSGREWFGENFELDADQGFEFQVPGIKPGSDIKFVSEVMCQSFNPSSFEIFYNGQTIAEQPVAVIPDSQYSAKGRMKRDTVIIQESTVSAAASVAQTIRYSFKRAASRRSVGFLNFFSAHFERNLALQKDQIMFRNGNTLNRSSLFSIANVSSTDLVWNISDPFTPVSQTTNLQSGTSTFSSSTGDTAEEFIVFRTNNIPSPELVGVVPNQNLRSVATPDLLIVTHTDFIPEANRLAEHRRSYNGMAVAVVTTDQVYNEFSSGRPDVTAIRDFIRFLYLKNSERLKSVLLFGKSSYDYRGRLPNNTNFVPTYESRNSLLPLETFSSDDYFAFLETSEGEWAESIFETHTLEIGVGRLPVKTLDESRSIVDKIIAYDLDADRFGKWRKDIVFVADDGSNSDTFSSVHQVQANSMAETIEASHEHFNTRKIFLGSFTKKVSPNGETIPEANIEIMEEFDDAVIINYTGHGSEKLWADERVLSPDEIEKLRNRTYPFLVTATCEFGRHDDPLEISSAENSLLREAGGAIGLVTTARPVNSGTNFELNQAFYEALFENTSGSWLTIGEIFRRTKNNSTSGVANRNFSLLGDPSMTLAMPLQTVVVDYLKTEGGSDTLKALSRVLLKGRVTSTSGETLSNFTGTAEATLFDKRTKFQTIGKNDPAFQYSQWFNPVFRGQASVVNGKFELEFILPKNIAYGISAGKLSLYAFDDARSLDATGGTTSFRIGGSEPSPEPDNQSPFIGAFMGDSTFTIGGTVSRNSTLVVRLKDESGINISNYGIGNTMMAFLDDDSQVFLINDHFLADKDDFTSGWVNFPVYDLEPGKHTFTVKAWDSYNNPAETTIEFVVSDGNGLMIEQIGNTPNPFQSETTVFFTHNRAGDDLTANLVIVNGAGAEIRRYDFDIPASTYKVNLLKFEDMNGFGKKLPPGLYFARLRVRSDTDGTESMRVAKLILAN